MFTKVRSFLIVFLVCFVCSWSSASVLDLDLYSEGTGITDQYASEGILFSSEQSPNALMSNHGPYSGGLFYNNIVGQPYEVVISEPPGPILVYDVIYANFCLPGDPLSLAATNFFTAKVLDITQEPGQPGYSVSKIEAYDANGVFLGEDSVSSSNQVEPYIHQLTLSFQNMHEIRLYPEGAVYAPGHYSHNGWFDIEFTEPQVVPEPSTTLMFIFGLGWFFRKKLRK